MINGSGNITSSFTSNKYSSAKTLNASWSGGTLTSPNPTWTGHTFNGWYTDASGGTKVVNGNTSYTPGSTRTLYAQWSAKTYTLTLNPNGGTYNSTTGNSTKTMTYGSTSNNSIGVPTRTNYQFNGWYTAESGGTQVYNASGQNVNASSYWTAGYSSGTWKYDGNVTLYAQWTLTGCTAAEVSYSPADSSWNPGSVKNALDILYTKLN